MLTRSLGVAALAAVLSLVAMSAAAHAQDAPFKWNNELPPDKTPLLRHGLFASNSNKAAIGYYIYLPPGYDAAENADKRYPVIYYLHGGRPGNESRSVAMADIFDEAIRAGRVPPMIYVFVNGGAMSHYDYPPLNSHGETAFVKELIPHIDAAYRTIASRAGRGIEGFSQGGRGTARIMFLYPELFCSAAPMGGGQQYEKHIAEHDGVESEGIRFEPGNNTYDLARRYATRQAEYPLAILVAVGKQDPNYEPNLDWMRHLESLGIPFISHIAENAPHNPRLVYESLGDQAMLFHAKNFHLVPPAPAGGQPQ